MSETCAIILAGGAGDRSGASVPKQMYEICGRAVLEYTLDIFLKCSAVDKITVVVRPELRDLLRARLEPLQDVKPLEIVDGGATRRESSWNAVRRVEDDDKVLIHDAVRPFLSTELIKRCADALDRYDAVYPVIPSANTIVHTEDGEWAASIPRRQHLMIGQTPQGFRGSVIKEAHLRALNDPRVDEEVTNDCGLVARYRLAKIRLIPGEYTNIKITYPEDLLLAEAYLRVSALRQESVG